jgi:hypothetical protein
VGQLQGALAAAIPPSSLAEQYWLLEAAPGQLRFTATRGQTCLPSPPAKLVSGPRLAVPQALMYRMGVLPGQPVVVITDPDAQHLRVIELDVRSMLPDETDSQPEEWDQACVL